MKNGKRKTLSNNEKEVETRLLASWGNEDYWSTKIFLRCTAKRQLKNTGRVRNYTGTFDHKYNSAVVVSAWFRPLFWE